MNDNRIKTKREYVMSVGVIRVGLLLVSIYLLQHLFTEPRRAPMFHPLADAALVLSVCALLGYLAGLVLWRYRESAGKKEKK